MQIGENFSQVYVKEKALAAGACDLAMPDFERIGGVTGWQRAAKLAQNIGFKMSSHLYPGINAHLLATTPTAHWLEYADWINAVIKQPLRIVDGHAVIPDRPGNGLTWNEAAVHKFRMA